jgi:hypothetical protein
VAPFTVQWDGKKLIGTVEGALVGHCNKNDFSEINRTKEWKPSLMHLLSILVVVNGIKCVIKGMCHIPVDKL